MGTRGLAGIIYKKKFRIGLYNSMDSYPEVLGLQMVEVCQKISEEYGWDTFKKTVTEIKFINDKSVPTLIDVLTYQKNGIYKKQSYPANFDELLEGLIDDYPKKILFHIAEGKLKHVHNDIVFIKDSLFCEHAYIINLNTDTLDYYRGFQKVPDSTNIFGQKKGYNRYYPCKKIKSYKLDLMKSINSINSEIIVADMIKTKNEI